MFRFQNRNWCDWDSISPWRWCWWVRVNSVGKPRTQITVFPEHFALLMLLWQWNSLVSLVIFYVELVVWQNAMGKELIFEQMSARARVWHSRWIWDEFPCGIYQLRSCWLMWPRTWPWMWRGSLTRLRKTYVKQILVWLTVFSVHRWNQDRIWDGAYRWHGCLHLRFGRVSGSEGTTTSREQFVIFNRVGDKVAFE